MEQTYSDSGSARTITAFFDSRDDAQRALDRLDALGLPDGSAKLVRGNDASDANGDNEHRGFWESLSDFFFPDDDRAAYAEGLRRGGFLVTAKDIPADKYAEALDILDDEGSVDVDARAGEWRSEGWSGSSYGDGRPFERDSAASATDLSMAGTGVGTSAFTGGKLAGGTGGYDADRDISSVRAGTDIGTSDGIAARNEAVGETDLVGVAGPSNDQPIIPSGRSTTLDGDTGLDRNARLGSDEAITSSAAPVASDAARLDDTYENLSRQPGRRDMDTGRTRARSYSWDGIAAAETARGHTDVEVEDDRGFGRAEGTTGSHLDAGTRR